MRWFHAVVVLSAIPIQVSAVLDVAAAQSSGTTMQIVARVDGEAVYRVEVEHALAGIARKRPATDLKDDLLFGQMLDQIIRRRLVHRRLEVLGNAASKYEIERALAKKKAELKKRARSLDDVVAKSEITLAIYRRDLAWSLSWAKFRAESLSDEELAAFFQKHRREFDATTVRARHILLGIPTSNLDENDSPQSENARTEAVLRAENIRQQITKGKMTFVEAARKFSSAPSSESGGDLGFFPRRGVMHQSVAAAAFGLKKGGISQPIVSPFGVQLIQVTDEQPGSGKWIDVREELFAAAARNLFEQLAAEQQKTSQVERIWKPVAADKVFSRRR